MLNDRMQPQPVRKCLVVDDHAAFRQVVRDFLSGASVEVMECGDGASALGVCAEQSPDWILMDVEMPGMDGFTATREILRQFSAARVIILTQHDSPDYRGEARAAGACAFIRKDDLAQLRTIMNQSPQ